MISYATVRPMGTNDEQASVTEALYHARGNPPFDKPVSFTENKTCGNCHRRRPTGPARKVLTSQFGSWDDIVQDHEGGRWLCLPCASTYRAADLRRRTTRIDMNGDLTHPDLAELRTSLSKPVPMDVALIVPISGKKIIAPRAQWGKVVTDTGSFTWSARHKRSMEYATILREMGFPESSLREESPAFPILAAPPFDQHEHVRAMWKYLAPTRADKSLLPLILLLSRKVKTT